MLFVQFILKIYVFIVYSVFPYLNNEKNQVNELSEDEKAMAEDYSNPVFRGVIDRLRARKEEKLKAEAELEKIQIN